jgi:hypothetical protein
MSHLSGGFVRINIVHFGLNEVFFLFLPILSSGICLVASTISALPCRNQFSARSRLGLICALAFASRERGLTLSLCIVCLLVRLWPGGNRWWSSVISARNPYASARNEHIVLGSPCAMPRPLASIIFPTAMVTPKYPLPSDTPALVTTVAPSVYSSCSCTS